MQLGVLYWTFNADVYENDPKLTVRPFSWAWQVVVVRFRNVCTVARVPDKDALQVGSVLWSNEALHLTKVGCRHLYFA